MKKAIFLSVLLTSLSIAGSTYASGGVRCETQYGGGEVCVTTGNVQINKKVCDIATANCDPESNYRDNMGLNDHLFTPGDKVIYRLEVTNVGNETLSTVNVTDTLPPYISLVSGELSYTINNLQPGATNIHRFDATVPSDIPVGTFCDPETRNTTNTATAVSGEDSDTDTSTVCVAKQGQPTTAVPEAGPETWQIYLTSSLLLAGSGIFLKHFAR